MMMGIVSSRTKNINKERNMSYDVFTTRGVQRFHRCLQEDDERGRRQSQPLSLCGATARASGSSRERRGLSCVECRVLCVVFLVSSSIIL